jgi:hypothetical protein
VCHGAQEAQYSDGLCQDMLNQSLRDSHCLLLNRCVDTSVLLLSYLMYITSPPKPANAMKSQKQLHSTNTNPDQNASIHQRLTEQKTQHLTSPPKTTSAKRKNTPSPQTSHDSTTTTPRPSPPSTSNPSPQTRISTLFISMHHLGLSGPSPPAPATRPVRSHLLLCNHELRPLPLQPPRRSEISPQHPLRVFFHRRLVGVEALELDDLRWVGVFAHDVNAWRY